MTRLLVVLVFLEVGCGAVEIDAGVPEGGGSATDGSGGGVTGGAGGGGGGTVSGGGSAAGTAMGGGTTMGGGAAGGRVGGGRAAGGSAGGGRVGGGSAGGTAGGRSGGGRSDGGVTVDGGSIGLTPLTDFAPGQTYLGHPGLLYPGTNDLPAAHLARAPTIQPLLPDGGVSAAGSIVVLSIGMSNTTQEFCAPAALPDGGAQRCTIWSFVGQAEADGSLNPAVKLVNGARSSQTAGVWANPASAEYDRIRNTVLPPLGLTELQVQVVWLKVANPQPMMSLPSSTADAFTLEGSLGAISRNLKQQYPNLKHIYLSSRIYAGYATASLNPEPFAFESGLSVKWLIEAQLNQLSGQTPSTVAGDLSLTSAPWLAWGPYLWADGQAGRATDALTWEPTDFEASDGTHPARSAETKVGGLLLNFFKTSPTTRCWFVSPQPSGC